MQEQVYWYNNNWIRLTQHLLFLALSYFILLNMFKTSKEVQPVDHIYTVLFMATILPVVYINLKILLPRFGTRLRWYLYAPLLLGLTTIFVWINIQLFDNWSVFLFKNLFFIAYYSWWEILFFFIAFLFFPTLLKLSKSCFFLKDLHQRLLTIEKERVDMELRALKAQVNPHFFFNTLNSIYSLSLDKDERLPSTVLQLSGIMRYYLYESKDDLVSLEKEISIIKDYVALQRIRSGDKLEIRMNITGEHNGMIAPLLLISFVENAFKHGVSETRNQPYVDIHLSVNKRQLAFVVKNSTEKSPEELSVKENIGLSNLRRQLELLYTDYNLSVQQGVSAFTATLKINLASHVKNKVYNNRR